VVGLVHGFSTVEERTANALCTSTLGDAFVADLIRLLPFVPATIHSLLFLSSTTCYFRVTILSQKKQPQKTTLLEKKKKNAF